MGFADPQRAGKNESSSCNPAGMVYRVRCYANLYQSAVLAVVANDLETAESKLRIVILKAPTR